jgi:hypothetical protein
LIRQWYSRDNLPEEKMQLLSGRSSSEMKRKLITIQGFEPGWD